MTRGIAIQGFDAMQKPSGNGSAVASLVYTEKFGARGTFSKEMLANIGAEGTVCMGMDEYGLYVGAWIEGCNEYALRDGGRSKMTLYCKPLIEEIAQQFELDYSSQTTHSFYEVEYLEIDGYTVAFIPLRDQPDEGEADSDD